MTRMKRWWRGMSRRTVLGAGMAAVVVIGLLTLSLSSVFAVYDLGLFELDGDATDDPAVKGEDWDLIYNTWIGNVPPESETDALLFIADKMGTMDDSFTKGSKDIDDIPDWTWTEKSVPNKNELTNAYAAV
ncbi:MAG: hypothetical protein U9R72_15645, partial [Chloroflexota bacterium]|nr:hypothetical protein [Chloroflexota bacterium]